ncbi:MAG: hypothetical protein U0263_00515 [Polyangiaceae bacterium]
MSRLSATGGASDRSARQNHRSAGPERPTRELCWRPSGRRLDPEHPYTRQLWDRIHRLLKVNCGGGGWTESIDKEVKDGKIVFFEDTHDQPNPRLVGARVL